MTDEMKDPTEREREDEDLEMDEEQAEDVKGGLLSSGSDFSMSKFKPPPPPTTTSPTTTDPTIQLPTSPTSPTSTNPLQRGG